MPQSLSDVRGLFGGRIAARFCRSLSRKAPVTTKRTAAATVEMMATVPVFLRLLDALLERLRRKGEGVDGVAAMSTLGDGVGKGVG